MTSNPFPRAAVRVTVAGALVNFSLGIYYAWSVFADGLIRELGWSRAEAMFPYTLELLIFSIAMIFGGRFQDRFGPRKGIAISGLLCGLSFMLCALLASPVGITLSFGFVFGVAAAFGYSAVTPAVIKWYPPEKRGLVTGIVLMSLGASALVWAPVVNLMLSRLGVINTFLVCGAFLLVAISASALAVELPPAYAPAEGAPSGVPEVGLKKRFSIVSNRSFRILWLMIGLSSGTGIMIVGNMVQLAELNYGVTWGFLLISLFAATNAAGRVAGGVLCDRFGCIGNLKVSVVMMIAAMVLFLSGLSWQALVAATFFLGLSYGSLYTAYPTLVAELFGLDNFGINYGMVFTAVGIVGSIGPLSAAYLAEFSGSYTPTFAIGLFASLACLILAQRLKKNSVAA